MDDESVWKEKRKALSEVAEKKHVKSAKDSGDGMGIDRHLLGKWFCFFRHPTE